MNKFLEGETINLLTLQDNVTPEDIRDFKLSLPWGRENPIDVTSRYNNIVSTLAANPVNTITKTPTDYFFRQAPYDTRDTGDVLEDLSERFSSTEIDASGYTPNSRGIKVESLATGRLAYRDTQDNLTPETLTGENKDDVFVVRSGNAQLDGREGQDTYTFRLKEMGENTIVDADNLGNIFIDTGTQTVPVRGQAQYVTDPTTGKHIEGKWTLGSGAAGGDGNYFTLDRGNESGGYFTFDAEGGNDLRISVGSSYNNVLKVA